MWRRWRFNVRSLIMVPETAAQHHGPDKQRDGENNTHDYPLVLHVLCAVSVAKARPVFLA